MRKSVYPNSTEGSPDKHYKKAHLNLEYMSRDICSLNFICHGDDTQLVLFDLDWNPLQMDAYLNDISKNKNYSVNITSPRIIRRDNLDIKDTIELIERKIQENNFNQK